MAADGRPARSRYGRLDMVNHGNSSVKPYGHAALEPMENFEHVTAVDRRGVWACMKHELRVMRDRGSGAIVNCSSLGSLVGLPQRAAYSRTEHGVLGMTKSAGVRFCSTRHPHQHGIPGTSTRR